MTRPDRDQFWYGLAAQYATRATGPRAAIGAVLTKFDRLIGAGFNGAPESEPHCPDTAEHIALDHCRRARHAEINALRNALLPPHGATLYVVGQRSICPHCSDRLREAGVMDIRWQPSVSSLDVLARQISEWGAATFPSSTPASTAEHLRREAVEILADPTNGEEQADAFFLLVQLVRVSGTDLTAEVARKLAINRQRRWQAPDLAGVVEHVRSEVTP